MSTEDLARHKSADDPNPVRSMTHDVLNSIGECVYQWDVASDRLTWSGGASKLLHVPRDASIDSCEEFNKLLLPAATKSREEIIQLSEAIDRGKGVPYRLQYALSGKKIGTVTDLWLEDTGCWFGGSDGKPVRAHGVIRVINENRSIEERLERISRFDTLTGLFNRAPSEHLPGRCFQSPETN